MLKKPNILKSISKSHGFVEMIVTSKKLGLNFFKIDCVNEKFKPVWEWIDTHEHNPIIVKEDGTVCDIVFETLHKNCQLYFAADMEKKTETFKFYYGVKE